MFRFILLALFVSGLFMSCSKTVKTDTATGEELKSKEYENTDATKENDQQKEDGKTKE